MTSNNTRHPIAAIKIFKRSSVLVTALQREGETERVRETLSLTVSLQVLQVKVINDFAQVIKKEITDSKQPLAKNKHNVRTRSEK